MQTTKQDGEVPIRVWATDADAGTMEQAHHLAALPFAVGAVCLMPDAHVGYGMPIGGVLATAGVVIPNAVGVDIGCGMLAARTTLEGIERETLAGVLGLIRKVVPVGFAHHVTPQNIAAWEPGGPISKREAEKARTQVGTLGGGNHFIEIQAGDDGRVWVMIHSGSRNIGKQVADHYNDTAKSLNARWRSSIPAAWDLAFLPMETDEGAAYLSEMQSCLAFAERNRAAMLTAVLGCLGAETDRIVAIHHNYAALEHHFGQNVMVHRKGAIRARAYDVGIIPGSQGTHSYIVRGLENPASFTTSSHGAGRKMGRKQAERSLDLAEEQRKLDAAGVLHAVRGKGDLDEAPGAYKDIDAVMAAQADLTQIVTTLRPLAVVKG